MLMLQLFGCAQNEASISPGNDTSWGRTGRIYLIRFACLSREGNVRK